ncbi:M28 family metallopeptidase [Tsuneonella suprasediminis]|uniref:M28 family metallopeptidase n=1 Tax=Tsuneonella suprasediminis TaxID=2306996 RepID=UPI002F940FEB
MTLRHYTAAAIVSLALVGCTTANPPAVAVAAAPAPTVQNSAPQADPARMDAIIRTLASDEFEGRAPGTHGETKTIAYLVEQFRKLGLEPGAPNGAWTTEVPLLHTKLDTGVPLQLATGQGAMALRQGEDVYISTQRNVDRAVVDNAPLVFVGYGVTAPEKGWDDFKGADLKGKIAVFLVNDPDFGLAEDAPNAGLFGGQAMTYYGRWTYKFEEAVRQGAIGALIVHDTPAAGYGWNTIVSPGGENYDLVQGPDGEGRLMIQGWLSGDAAQRVFAAAGLDLAKQVAAARSRNFKPVPLVGARLSANVPVSSETVQSHNVIAKITGATRPAETISYGAHWDAYGIGATADGRGKTIRAGALDDASGIAAMMEVARMFKSGTPPQRTILFGIWTAEERGLLGSEHFVASNLYPADKMVADITFDTLQPNGKARDFVLIGKGQSTLEDYLAKAAAAQGRTITPDARPERGLFYRADHFSFAKRGVPSLIVMALGGGVDLVNGGRAAGDKWVSDFTANCYHQPCDDWKADWDLSGAAQDADLGYAIGRELADSDAWPKWKPGSEFAGKRK